MIEGNLPPGWDLVPLGGLGRYINGRAFKPADWETSGLPIIRIQNLTNVEASFNYFSGSVEDKYYVHSGDLLISWSATLGAFIWDRSDAILNQHIFRVEVNDSRVDKLYLKYAVQSALDELSERTHGATMRHVTKGEFESFQVPVPRSLTEQRRIVARLEALLGDVREMRQLQAEIEKDVGRFMEAVLAEVFSQYSAAEMKPIGEIADVKGGKRLPKGEDFAVGVTDHPYLRVTDFRDFSIDRSGLRYLKPETYQMIRRYTISADDLYISIAGTIGLVGTIPHDLDGANLTENAAKLVFKPEYKDRVDKEFIVFYLESLQGRRQIEERSKAAGQPKLALMRIETIEVPILPSLAEQQQTVAYIRNIARELQELHDSDRQDRLAIDALEQSILAQAFRGEL